MDDDVEITDVVDDDFADHGVPLENQDMSSVSAVAGELLSQYGWALLAVTVVLYLAIQQLSKRRSVQRNTSQPPPSQQDASFVARNQEAMEAARRKMQEELNAKAAIFREKQKQQEEEKRRQKIDMWDNIQHGKSNKGYRLSDTTENASTSSTVHQPKTDKRPLRSRDYNPLTGDGGGTCSWRPGRRGPSSGG